jgi:hypothetical protein
VILLLNSPQATRSAFAASENVINRRERLLRLPIRRSELHTQLLKESENIHGFPSIPFNIQ